jgi:argininosuccinate lyase
MTSMIADMTAKKDAMRRAADRGYVTATDLADWLVRALGLPFREAHHISGRLVKQAETQGVQLYDLPLETFQAVEPKIDDRVYSVLTVEASVASRLSEGGTAPDRVKEAVAAAKVRFL